MKSGGKCGDPAGLENVKSGNACNRIPHCYGWYDSLPNMTGHLNCYGNIKIVTNSLNRKKGVANRVNLCYYIIRRNANGEPHSTLTTEQPQSKKHLVT